MVDFNNEATVGTPAVNIVRILVLQARANVFESLEYYNKQRLTGAQANSSVLRARVITWFLEHQAYLKRTLKGEDYKKLEEDLLANGSEITLKRIIEIICFLNETLDNLKIIKIDTKQYYNRSSIEAENLAHHL